MTNNKDVKAWKEKVTIPTYGIGEPEKNPIFCEKRVYQGSSGVVYPLPVIEKYLKFKVCCDFEVKGNNVKNSIVN